MSKRFLEVERSAASLRILAENTRSHPKGAPVVILGEALVVLGGSIVRAAGQGTVATIALDADPQREAALLALERSAEPSPAVIAAAAGTLRGAGVPLSLAGSLLGCSMMDASCWARLGLNPELLGAVGAGHVSFGHARYLLSAPASRRLVLLGACMGGRWTVKHLRQVVASGGAGSSPAADAADLADYRRQLEEALGAEVGVDWRPNRRSVRIAWHDVPTLQGVFERLVSVRPNAGPAATGRQRWLVINVVDTQELDELFGHLVDNGEG